MTLENPSFKPIASDLARRIDAGEFALGERLPSRWELAEKYGVPTSVVQRATIFLEANGYVRGVKGKGVYVNRAVGTPEEVVEGVLVRLAVSKWDEVDGAVVEVYPDVVAGPIVEALRLAGFIA
ncbi:winged helix-turn-helix domain-containing protein [Microbispora sp. NPDC049125]|uniref:winged helix-turn-helix domain-containing protein n=1 Tax=Microbispora sp. NPDC049125 TaxID=3154929 RepID=UPI0034676B6E